ncbi:MAG: hypothetical protein IPN86_19130 [Saprospiraceae bacterium]|nr:hypothetical protein [Saprospiraceae bacterium]
MSNFIKLLILAFIIQTGCKQDNAKSLSTKDVVTKTNEPTGPEIPGVPQDVMVKMLNECTSVDYIFHVLPFSLSQDEDPSVDQNIGFIDINRPLGRIPSNCKKADARKFFKIKSDVVYDVDVYVTNNCKFYVFVDKNNKPIFANYMTQAGINFYDNIFKQASGMSQQ